MSCPGLGPLRGDGVGANQCHRTAQEASIEEREGTYGRIGGLREMGSYRGAAAMCGTTHKTVGRIVQRHIADGVAGSSPRRDRGHNYDDVYALVVEGVDKTVGRISAKRLLPAARTAGYTGWAA